MKIPCSRCKGAKKVIGNGMMKMLCPTCNGDGSFEVSFQPEEPIKINKRGRPRKYEKNDIEASAGDAP